MTQSKTTCSTELSDVAMIDKNNNINKNVSYKQNNNNNNNNINNIIPPPKPIGPQLKSQVINNSINNNINNNNILNNNNSNNNIKDKNVMTNLNLENVNSSLPMMPPITKQEPKLGQNYQKLFVTNIPGVVDEETFKQLVSPFAKNGSINDIKFKRRVVSDTCYAFVEFESGIDGKECMDQLNRRVLSGHTIRVGPAARRNPSLSDTNIYIEGLPSEWKDNDLKKCFEPYGNIQVARVLYDSLENSSKSKEVGFVHFETHEEALLALTSLNEQKPFPEAKRSFQIKFANKGRKKEVNKKLSSNKHFNRNKNANKHINNNLNNNNSNSLSSISNLNSISNSNILSNNNSNGKNNNNIGSSNDNNNQWSSLMSSSNRSSANPNDSKFNEICKYFQRGLCKRGNSCYYRHISNDMYGNYLQPNQFNNITNMGMSMSSMGLNTMSNMGFGMGITNMDMYNGYNQAYANQYQFTQPNPQLYSTGYHNPYYTNYQQTSPQNPQLYQQYYQQQLAQQQYQQQLVQQQQQTQQHLQQNNINNINNQSNKILTQTQNNNSNNNSNNHKLDNQNTQTSVKDNISTSYGPVTGMGGKSVSTTRFHPYSGETN